MKSGRYSRWHLWLVVGFLIMAALACTLPWPRREAGPSVVIDSPPSGTTVEVGQEVTIQSTSTDGRGVTKVELWVDEVLVHTDFSPVAKGQTPFSVLQSWTPLSAGEYTIVVKAYNAAEQVGESEAITLSAVEVIAEASPTPSLEATETATLVVVSPTPTEVVASPTPTSIPTSTPTGVTPMPTETTTPTSTPTATPPAGPCLPTSVATISVEGDPKGVAAGANRVYVGLHDAPQVKVIDRASNTVVDAWDTKAAAGPGRYANGVVLTRRHVYVANRNQDSVSVINIDDPTDVKVISVGKMPFGVAAGTDYVFVTNFGSDNVTIIDSRTVEVAGTVSVPGKPTMVAALGNNAYVASWSGGVYKVEGTTLSATQIVPPRQGYFGVAANTATGQVFVTNVRAKNIMVIDSATDSVVTTIAIEPPYALHGLAVNPRNGYLYVASADADAIYVFDGLEEIGTLGLSAQDDDEGGQGITVYGDRLYMTLYDQGELSIWDDSACD